jgi:hypothetical protein
LVTVGTGSSKAAFSAHIQIKSIQPKEEEVTMEIRKSLLSAAAAAALIVAAGGAYAAGDKDSMSSGSSSTNSTINQPSSASPAPTSPVPGDRDSAAGAQQMNSAQGDKVSTPPSFIVGKDVVNAQGDKIGTVEKIEGNNVIVSVGGFLGIGSHDVSVAWNQLSMSGTGDQAKLKTSLTKDELKAMPEYKANASDTMRDRSATGTGSTGANGVDRPLGSTDKGNLNH